MIYLRRSLKLFFDYCISLLIFSLFIITFFKYRIVFSFFIFIIMALLIYGDSKRMGSKEKTSKDSFKVKPLGALFIGIIAFSPVILIELISIFMVFNDSSLNNIKHLIIYFLLGPYYGFLKLGADSIFVYISVSAVVPFITVFGYTMGYYGRNLKSLFPTIPGFNIDKR